MDFWLVGDATPGAEWSVVGLFASESEAFAAAERAGWYGFVGPLTLGEEMQGSVPWVGAYYPSQMDGERTTGDTHGR